MAAKAKQFEVTDDMLAAARWSVPTDTEGQAICAEILSLTEIAALRLVSVVMKGESKGWKGSRALDPAHYAFLREAVSQTTELLRHVGDARTKRSYIYALWHMKRHDPETWQYHGQICSEFFQSNPSLRSFDELTASAEKNFRSCRVCTSDDGFRFMMIYAEYMKYIRKPQVGWDSNWWEPHPIDRIPDLLGQAVAGRIWGTFIARVVYYHLHTRGKLLTADAVAEAA